MKKKMLAVLSVAFVSTLALSSCAAAGATGGEDTVTLYSNNNSTVNDAFVAAAAELSPTFKVEVVQQGSTSALLQRIGAEAGENSADVFGNATPAVLEANKDLFEGYESPEASALPQEAIQPDHLWTVQNIHVAAMMVNTDQTPAGKAPTSWKDLTDPAWKGKILSGNPLDSGTTYTALYAAYSALNESDFAALYANLVITDDTDTLYPAVAQGEYAVSLGYESNIVAYIEGGQTNIEIVYPADGTNITYEAVAIVKNASNPEGAKRLLDAMLSKATQTKILEETFRRPTRTDIDVTKHSKLKPIDQLKIIDSRGSSPDEREAFTKAWEALAG